MDLNRVVAPMVGQSDAPFRSLCLKYGASCVYTEMLYSNKIVHDENYLEYSLPQSDHLLQEYGYQTRPLVVQICGNDPHILSEAVAMIAKSGRADAIDFNLGCPQERAKVGLFGSYLLDKCHWPLVFECVRAMVTELVKYRLPLFCKIRLVAGSNIRELTQQFCFGLYDCGVRVICIHGRTRGSMKHRRVGPADLETIAKIAFDLHRYHQSHLDCNQECLKHLFVISNGNIITPHDIQRNVEYYQGLHSAEFSPPLIGGVMSGEGVLKDPAIFHRYLQLSHPSSSITQPTLKELFTEYCYLSNLYASLNGWEGLDILERKKSSSHQLFEIGSSNESVSSPDSRQLSIARQHLNWILGKSGHGRLIRYQYKADSYKRHTDLMNDINNCKTIQELLEIAETCLI